MKFTVHRHLASEEIWKFVPRRFASQLREGDFAAGESVLIVFPHDKVILSSHALRAIEQLTELSESVRVAIGYNFTSEAREMLASHGFRLVAERDWPWTDASYKSLTHATV